MSVYETSITNPKKQLEFYKDLSEQLQKENERLKNKIKTYEDPEDMTLMFMWCGDKAKDKIKELEHNWNELKKWVEENKFDDNYESYQLDNYISHQQVLNKMQEIESGNDD